MRTSWFMHHAMAGAKRARSGAGPGFGKTIRRTPTRTADDDRSYAVRALTILPGSRGGSPLGSASTSSMPSVT